MKRTIEVEYEIKDKIEELKEIGENYRSDTNYFYSRYSGIKNINRIDFREIRDKDLKKIEHLKLKSNYLQRCLNAALGNIKSMWSNTLRLIKSNINANNNLSEEEKHFLYIVIKSRVFVDYVVNTNKTFEDLMKNKYFSKWKKENKNFELNEKKLRQYLRRQIRRTKPSIPNTKKEDYFKIDNTLYSFKENKLYISNPTKKMQRIELISKNSKEYRTEATVKIDGNKLRIGFPIEVKQKALKNNGVNEIGIDKGFIDLITTSNNKIYGHRYCDEIKGHIDKYLSTQKERGKYWSLYYKYKTINPKKAERIKKNNLGYIKFNKNKKLTQETKKKFINQSINRFIKEERPTEIIVEDLSWKKKSKKKRYRLDFDLSTWDKGYLQERLEFKAYENNIKITTVNPAYTSQICSCCGKLGERVGKDFKCNSCNQVLDADYNAAINIKKRKENASITTYMKPKKVLEILKL